MKVTYNGEEHEAFSLVMRKENALDILHGKKTIETRAYSKKYFDMFFDNEARMRNVQRAKQKKFNEFEYDFKPIFFVHFYSTGAPWSLDVRIERIDELSLEAEETKTYLNENGFHDFDAEIDKYSKEEWTGERMFFAIKIAEVVASRGLE